MDHLVAVILSSMTIGIALFSIGLLLRNCALKSDWPLHSIALVYFLSVMVFEAADQINLTLPAEEQRTWLRVLLVITLPSLGACIWFYIRSITTQNDWLSRKDVWHLLPVLTCSAAALPVVFSGADMSADLSFGLTIAMFVAWITWLGMLIYYFTRSLIQLVRHRQKIRDLYSRLKGLSLAWLQGLIGLVAICAIILLVVALLPAISETSQPSRGLIAAFYLGVVFTVSLFGIPQQSTIPIWNELPESRYKRSALRSGDLARIAAKLDSAMRDQKFWQNPDLSLLDLSQATCVSQNNISQSLNEHLGMNFYDYVNRWRVDQACRALCETDQQILSIAEEVGFNSKSTFNAAFKKHTGQTPRAYRASKARK